MTICSKVFTIIGTSLIVAVGLAGVALSIYLFVQNQIWTQIIGNYQLTFAILFIAASILIFITGILGLVGASTDNKCLLHTQWILLFIWLAAFIAAGVVGVLLPTKVFAGGCLSDNTFGVFTQLQSKSLAASSSNFCTSGCQCYIANDALRAQIGSGASSDSSLAKNVVVCSGWSPTNEDSVMAALQIAFKCNGWCSRPSFSKIFYFSNNDKSQTQPTDTCFNAFSNFFANYGKYVYIAAFVFSGLIFILVLCVWIHICLLNEENEQKRLFKNK